MSVSILVVTPYNAFGELLRISLEDNGQYQVRLVSSGIDACEMAGKGSFQLAILDAAITDMPFVPFCKEILEQQKGIRWVIIPPENDPNHPSLGGLLPHGYISRPFYLPDLIETIARLIDERNIELSNPLLASPTIPFWLRDPLLMHSYLEQEISTTQAITAIVAVHGPSAALTMNVSCGQLPDNAVQEMTDIVCRYWNRDEKSDLMRFIRLTSDKQDYLVYATQMSGDIILILVYSTTSPLSQIRPQTKKLAHTLSTVPPKKDSGDEFIKAIAYDNDPPQSATYDGQPSLPSEGMFDKQNKTIDEPSFHPDHLKRQSPFLLQEEIQPERNVEIQANVNPYPQFPAGFEPETQPLDDFQFQNRSQSGFSPNNDPSDQQAEDSDEGLTPDLAALFGQIPSPDPDSFAINIENSQLEISDTETQITSTSPGDNHAPHQPLHTNNLFDPVLSDEPSTQEMDGVVLFQPSHSQSLDPAIDPLEDTRPHIVASLSSLGQLEPVSPALSQLNYTCVLLPRFPQHFLSGELADYLAQWIHQICLAFGWRLEAISLRPEYLQWTIQVAPSISPGNVVRIIRQRTSAHIFSQYPQYQTQNLSGDFWAVGYLIVSGAQPPSTQLLREYITQTRKRQGL